jgi:hypothetical protein
MTVASSTMIECPICNHAEAFTTGHPCMFGYGCSCWYGVPCHKVPVACDHPSIRGATPAMMEDGDYRAVCGVCLAVLTPEQAMEAMG